MSIWKIPNRTYRAGTFKENSEFDIMLPCVPNSTVTVSEPFDYDLVGRTISGTTSIVDKTTVVSFVATASVQTGPGTNDIVSESRTIEFTIRPELWDASARESLGVINESIEVSIPLPINSYKDVSKVEFEVISGKMPAGLYINNAAITGVAVEVPRETKYRFVIRATSRAAGGEVTVSDKTFELTVVGADVPVWTTPVGALKVGSNFATFILDSSYVDFQLTAIDQDQSAGQLLHYTLLEQDGELPPGLVLTPNGRITGFVQPLLEIPFGFTGTYDTSTYETAAYDLGFRTANGYDRWTFDFATFDLATQSLLQKKINRKYSFTVTVTDGDTIVKRPFSIYVVGGDHFRVDSEAHKVGEGAFTADASYVKAPIWTTPANLGVKRADNFHLFKLDVYEDPTEPYPIVYQLEKVNPEIRGTASPIIAAQQSSFLLTVGRDVIIYTVDSVNWVTLPMVRGKPILIPEIARSITITTDNVAVITNSQESLEFPLAVSLVATAASIDTIVKIEDSILKVSTTGSPFVPVVLASPIDVVGVTYSYNKFIALGKYGKMIESNNGVDWVFIDSNTRQDLESFINIVSSTSTIQLKKTTGRDPVVGDLIHFSKYVPSAPNKVTKITQVTKINTTTFNLTLDADISFTLPNNSDIQLGSASAVPPGMQFDQGSGEILGTIPYMPATTKTYKFTITATRLSDSAEQTSSSRTFSVNIIGEVESAITWETAPQLGIIQAETISTLSVKAHNAIEQVPLWYTLTSGGLPPGLSLNIDGEIVGKVNQYKTGYHSSGLTSFEPGFTLDGGETTIDRSFYFTVTARDLTGTASSSQSFELFVNADSKELYCDVFVQTFLPKDQRSNFTSFISSPEIFNPELIYRANDPNFGVQKDLKTLVFAGVELIDYNVACRELRNQKTKRFVPGNVLTANAKMPGSKKTVYEVVYLELIDPLEHNGVHLPDTITVLPSSRLITIDQALNFEHETYTHLGSRPDPLRVTIDSTTVYPSDPGTTIRYPSSISLWREKIKRLGKTDRNFLPLWMRTPQGDEINELGYRLCVPLCFCKPGGAEEIVRGIKHSGFDFSMLDFTVDRFTITRSLNYNYNKYIIFNNDRTTI